MVSSGLRCYPFFNDSPKAPSFAKRRIKFTTPRKPLGVRSSHFGMPEMQLFLGHSLETVSRNGTCGSLENLSSDMFPVYIQKLSFDVWVVRNYDTTGASFQSMRPRNDRRTLEIMLPPSLGILALLLQKYNHCGRMPVNQPGFHFFWRCFLAHLDPPFSSFCLGFWPMPLPRKRTTLVWLLYVYIRGNPWAIVKVPRFFFCCFSKRSMMLNPYEWHVCLSRKHIQVCECMSEQISKWIQYTCIYMYISV